MSLKDALHWRYAPKRMTGATVAPQHIEAILRAAQYAPSSMGLQPFSLILVQDTAVKALIKPIAYNQPQIAEASHLLLFCAYTQLTQQHIDTYLQQIISVRGVSAESLAAFRGSMMRFAQTSSSEQIAHWAANQAYIALGFALAEAALLGVDVTPMEGFDKAALDKFFELPSQQLCSVALLAIGHRDEANDFLAKEKKVRKPLAQLVKRI